MADYPMLKELTDLRDGLVERQGMLGWLCQSHQFTVDLPDRPELQARVQQEIDETAQFLYLTHMFAIIEEAGFCLVPAAAMALPSRLRIRGL